MAWVEAKVGTETVRLDYAFLGRGDAEIQETLHRLYQSDARLICKCKREKPVSMHIRRYQTNPPGYCLVTNPREKHSPNCPRFATHIVREPVSTNDVPTEVTSVSSIEQVYSKWERSTFYVPSLHELNPEQQKAAMHKDGPCMVVAAAGSGKTAVLINRIQYLIGEGIAPRDILACTFTRKATQEMRTRLVDVIGRDAAKQVAIGTIHSIAYKMLKPGFDRDHWQLATDSTWLMESVLDKASPTNPYGVGRLYENTQDALMDISFAKAEALTPDQVKDETLQTVYRAYEALKQDRRILDFDDMLMYALQSFNNDKAFRDRWSRNWRYVLVDEFQDVNMAQWTFLLQLVKNHNNLYVIGDDFQSIYGFRGSRPDLLRDFTKTFPQAKKIVLDMNYRSHDLILDLAGRVIALNEGHQIDKAVRASRKVSLDNSTVEVVTTKTDRGEAQFVAEEIKRLRSLYPKIPWSEYAVLYRTNVQSRLYEETFVEYGIPYHVVGDTHFYENRDVKMLLDYLRVTRDHSDPEVWLHLLNRPRRFISNEVIADVRAGGWDAMLRHPKCQGFRETLAELSRYEQPADALKWLVTAHPNIVRQQDPDEPVKWVDSLIESAGRCETVPEFLRYVDWVIEKSKESNDDSVPLMTIHKSKGLEFWSVFVVDLVEGIFPHKKSMNAEGIREETRLCYVAITRAKENLYLTAAQQYGGEASVLSRYLQVLQQ